MKNEIPYNLVRRLIWVGVFAMLVAFVVVGLFFPPWHVLFAAMIVSPILWVAIACVLRKAGLAAYLVVGTLSSLVGLPLASAVSELLIQLDSVTAGKGSFDFEQVIGGFLLGGFYALNGILAMCLTFFPIGMATGGMVWHIMNREGRVDYKAILRRRGDALGEDDPATRV